MDLEEIYDILSSIQMGMRDKRNLAQLLFNGLDGQGTTDYNNLHNIPSINNIPLKGNLTLEKLGLTNLIKAIDNLTSNDKINALSANQGRILNAKITELITTIANIRTELENKADSSTTLAGYGITNSYTKTEVNNIIKNITSTNNKGLYYLQVSEFNTNKFNELLGAVESGQLVILNNTFLGINYTTSNNTITIISLLLDNTNTKANIEVGTFKFKIDGTYNLNSYNIPFTSEGDGTKFLSDNGTYKTITSGESYDLATQTSNGLMSKEDKIKLDGLGDASGIILTQAQYDALETYDNVVYFIKG